MNTTNRKWIGVYWVFLPVSVGRHFLTRTQILWPVTSEQQRHETGLLVVFLCVCWQRFDPLLSFSYWSQQLDGVRTAFILWRSNLLTTLTRLWGHDLNLKMRPSCRDHFFPPFSLQCFPHIHLNLSWKASQYPLTIPTYWSLQWCYLISLQLFTLFSFHMGVGPSSQFHTVLARWEIESNRHARLLFFQFPAWQNKRGLFVQNYCQESLGMLSGQLPLSDIDIIWPSPSSL